MTSATSSQLVTTSSGTAAVHIDRCDPAHNRGIALILGHGAGRGSDSPDLVAVAGALPVRGITVVRVDQPWVVAGRQIAPRAQVLDQAWLEVLTTNAVRYATAGSVIMVGGRSAGARVACRTASTVRARGVVAIAFPVPQPSSTQRGRGTQVRIAELSDAVDAGARPVLVVQGTRDRFADLRAMAGAGSSRIVVKRLPYADHSLQVPSRAPITRAEVLDLLVNYVVGFALEVSSRAERHARSTA